MKATEFCYWLQGMFEINPPTNGLTQEQVKIIMAHLNMVFYHEIDKSYPDDEQKKLNELHNTDKTKNQITNEEMTKKLQEYADKLKKDSEKYPYPFPYQKPPVYTPNDIKQDGIPPGTIILTTNNTKTDGLMRC